MQVFEALWAPARGAMADALGPKNGPDGRFGSIDHPTNARMGLQRASNFACGGFSAPRVVWRRLFGHLMSRWGAMAGFRAFRNENLGQNFSIPCDLATKTAANGAEIWHGSSLLP